MLTIFGYCEAAASVDVQNGWWRVRGLVVVGEPFDDDGEAHVAEGGHEKQNLWNELKKNVYRIFEVDRVHGPHTHPQGHVHHTNDDRQLHF